MPRAQCCPVVILELRKLMQENKELEAILDYVTRQSQEMINASKFSFTYIVCECLVGTGKIFNEVADYHVQRGVEDLEAQFSVTSHALDT